MRTRGVAGGKAKYDTNLSDWNRLSSGDTKRLAGVTGASVGAGRALKVTADLADASDGTDGLVVVGTTAFATAVIEALATAAGVAA